jgi:pimeloyl-ACP methyl ester carboxylesterase
MTPARFSIRYLAGAAAVLALGAIALPALAQLPTPRTLSELRAEVQERADRHAYPVSELEPAEVREALANLKSLDRDEWAAAWSAIGDRHLALGKKAELAETASRADASKEYKYAFEYYLFARFPLENSPGKVKAYGKALDAFAAYAKLQDPRIEIVRIPFEGKEIVGYLRLPPNVRPAPLVLSIGGLDGRKENASFRNDAYLAHGVGYLSLDMPGTGQSTIRQVVPGAEREFTRVLDWIATRPDLDAKRVVVYGGSWGGHWSARLSYTERARIRGAVVQGGPVHEYFQPEWQRKAIGTREYLFELFEARSAIYGAKTLEEFLAYGPKMSLKTAGWLDKPSAPMLVINGIRDTQVPVEDLFLLMRSGSPKEVWINPQGGHMGRNAAMSDQRIFEMVTVPWVVKTLNHR